MPIRSRARVAATVVCLAVGGLASLPSAQAALAKSAFGAAHSTGATTPMHRILQRGQALSNLVAVSPTDVWMVGDQKATTSNRSPIYQTLAIHWDGEQWSQVETPDPGGPSASNRLVSVAADAPNDVWAVGSVYGGGYTPLVEHWDGSAWTNSPLPDVLGALAQVVALAPDDVWAVGSGPNGPLALYYNGSSWTAESLPSRSSGFDAVAASSATDVWVGGWQAHPGDPVDFKPLIEHFDGTRWTVTRVAGLPQCDHIFSEPVIGLSNVGTAPMALGYCWPIGGGGNLGYADRWNGRGWRPFDTDLSVVRPVYLDLDVYSPTDGWLTGFSFEGGIEHTLFERWDGQQWSRVAAPQTEYPLERISADAPDDAWALGGRDFRHPGSSIAHWDGTQWTVVLR